MISQEDFTFQRHLELWKDQNRTVQRIIVLILLFGFLILFRVLIPFSEKTVAIGTEIQTKIEAKEKLEAKNTIVRQLEEQLAAVKETIRKRPWEKKKNELIQTFVQIKNRTRFDSAQAEADTTIRAIGNLVRNDIVAPLAGVLADHPDIAATMPKLSETIDALRLFANQWETDRIGQRWFRTLDGKNREMVELTDALNTQIQGVSTALGQTIRVLNQQIQTGDKQITALSKAIDEANERLKNVLDQLFPKWMKGIVNIQQMTQIYPMALIGLMLYLAWMVASMSRHFRYIARKLKFDGANITDGATASLWTMTAKSTRGTILTMSAYCTFILVVWALFEKGTDVLYGWIDFAQDEALLMSAALYQGLQWAGRAIFTCLIALTLLHKRLLFFLHPSN